MKKQKQIYPAWRYHRTEEARVVKDAAEDAALGPEWKNTPAAFDAPEAVEPLSGETEVKTVPALPVDPPSRPKRGRPRKDKA